MNAPFATSTEQETVDLGELTQSVGFMLRMSQIAAYAQFFQEFADTDISPGEFTVLWVINHNPDLRQGTLARTLRIKPAHMTKLVQRLVKSGFVKRTTPPEDRRSVRLSLTAKGKDHIELHRESFLKVHAAERIGLTDAETTTLLSLLSKLAFKGSHECR